MSTATDKELGNASILLAQLLEEAQNPASQDGGPIILQKQEFDISKVTAIRVIEPDKSYHRSDTDGTGTKKYCDGHELTKSLIADGYTIVTMMIVRCPTFIGPATEHKVNLILVKLRP